VIVFDRVSVTYPDGAGPVLSDVDLTVEEGELCVVVGETGSGKSTLLGAVNGLVPHFSGGTLAGRVTVAGLDTRTHPPRELAEVVGVVSQDPMAGFVTDTVEEELAYTMEQLAIDPSVMRKRVEETLDLLGIAELRRRPLRTLSGGQQQRVAIGAVLTAHPRVLVLDEPTSALDPTAAEEVIAAIARLVHDLGMTVVLAEHRLERVVQHADQVAYLPGDRTVRSGPPEDVLALSAVAPPVVELGRLAGWNPLPLSIRDARRLAGPLRDRLAEKRPTAMAAPTGPPALSARGVVVRYRDHVAVRAVDLDVAGGEVVALMGRNGSGKSSLLWAMSGAGRRDDGRVDVDGVDPQKLAPGAARAAVGLVPQTPADLLYRLTVAEECDQADGDAGAPPGTCQDLVERIVGPLDPEAHPRDLSEGQRLGLVLAIQLVAAPAVTLLDEPTRGLDYGAKARLAQVIADLAADGRAVVVATHDVEFVATVAHRVVVMAEGELVADGPAPVVLAASPSLAPQVSRILAPQEWLTVAQVAAALEPDRVSP
jgi:energy-coupling factor transport system ATP-binding protein